MIFLKGENFDLRTDDENYIDDFIEILNNKASTEGSQLGRLPISIPKKNDGKNLICAICTDLGNKPGVIGRVSLEDINYYNRTAELKIFVKHGHAKKGFGYGACKLIIDHAFNQLGLNRIHAGTLENNEGFKKLAEKLGMKKEGVRKSAVWKDGKFVDVIEFGLLKG